MKKFLLILVLLIFAISCKSAPIVEEQVQTPPTPPPVEELEKVVEEPMINTVVDEIVEEPMTNTVVDEIVEEPMTNANELIFPTGIYIRETERGKILVVEPKIIYDFASTNMTTMTHVSLRQVVEFMNLNANVSVIIEGHTSNIGIAYPYNYKLSAERVRNAKIYLVNSGINENRLIECPLGESLPEYPNQADLRRHEFVVITSESDLQVYNSFISRLDVRKETTYMGN
ncbi:OmpA family protein [uncultured Brachyspira sp.]|uniref:OmpA family protein n=1 Tax=uncultured Brachyspira sp. TaxID=221953 RepID=UPI0025962C8C|nr:OmpA family protein [uncultured Brachyspira sp.]